MVVSSSSFFVIPELLSQFGMAVEFGIADLHVAFHLVLISTSSPVQLFIYWRQKNNLLLWGPNAA
jgi:hypothetical protein